MPAVFFIQYAHTNAQNSIKILMRRCRVPAGNVWTPSSNETIVRVCSFGWRWKNFHSICVCTDHITYNPTHTHRKHSHTNRVRSLFLKWKTFLSPVRSFHFSLFKQSHLSRARARAIINLKFMNANATACHLFFLPIPYLIDSMNETSYTRTTRIWMQRTHAHTDTRSMLQDARTTWLNFLKINYNSIWI